MKIFAVVLEPKGKKPSMGGVTVGGSRAKVVRAFQLQIAYLKKYAKYPVPDMSVYEISLEPVRLPGKRKSSVSFSVRKLKTDLPAPGTDAAKAIKKELQRFPFHGLGPYRRRRRRIRNVRRK